MLPIMGPKPNENRRKESPIGPAGMRVPKTSINRKPTAKNKKIEVNIAPPKIKKKPVSLLALMAFYSIIQLIVVLLLMKFAVS